MAVGPRRMTAGEAPGRPEAETIAAPGTFPASCESGFDAGTLRSLLSMRATENGSLVVSVAPVTPVVTTAWRRLTSCVSEKFAVCEPAVSETVRVCGTYPIERTRITAEPPLRRAAGIV